MKLYLLLPAFLLLAACGFHLRGAQQLDTGVRADSSIALIAEAAEDVGQAVRNQLATSGTPILPRGTAMYTVLLYDQSLNRSVLSVSAETGKVEEYQLTLTVRMSVFDEEENEVVGGQPIQVTRDYPFDEQSVLGSVAEQRVLEQEMIRQAAAQILRRLDTLTRD